MNVHPYVAIPDDLVYSKARDRSLPGLRLVENAQHLRSTRGRCGAGEGHSAVRVGFAALGVGAEVARLYYDAVPDESEITVICTWGVYQIMPASCEQQIQWRARTDAVGGGLSVYSAQVTDKPRGSITKSWPLRVAWPWSTYAGPQLITSQPALVVHNVGLPAAGRLLIIEARATTGFGGQAEVWLVGVTAIPGRGD